VADPSNPEHGCRICGAPLGEPVVDLGMSPLSDVFPSPELAAAERSYPLQVHLCPSCGLAQLHHIADPAELFTEYAYFSSFSTSWVEHARLYADEMIDQLELGPGSLVVELASNDGYLLQHFRDRGIPVLGVEPAANVAEVAEARGIPTLVRFFGQEVAEELVAGDRQADLVVANNVLAQVPDLHDFVGGVVRLLAPDGLLTIEFPGALRLLEQTQFDTIYHEHFSYFSLGTVAELLRRQGLAIVDVEELVTHGGSLRVHARHAARDDAPAARVAAVLAAERTGGAFDRATWLAFADRVAAMRREMVEFLETARSEGRTVAGYGAPGKATTFLNYCGIGPDLLPYTVDRNPYKQGRVMPGTHNPIHPVEHIAETRPDYIWILPWNLREEIGAQLAYAREWGAMFIVAIPALALFY